MAKTSTPAAEVEKNRTEGLKSMDEDFVVCRELMHAWDEVTSYVSLRKSNTVKEITEVLRCNRCKTLRFDSFHVPSYELTRRRYEYPDGYHLKGVGIVRRSFVRAEKFRRRKPNNGVPDNIRELLEGTVAS